MGGRRRRDIDFGVRDFTTLYPSLPHRVVRGAIAALLDRIFGRHRARDGSRQLLRVLSDPRREVDRTGVPLDLWRDDLHDGTQESSSRLRYFDEARLMDLVNFQLDHSYVTLGDRVYRQICGIPIGAGAAPMVANLTLAYFEITGIEKMVGEAETKLQRLRAGLSVEPMGAVR